MFERKKQKAKLTRKRFFKKVYAVLVFLIVFQTTPIPFDLIGASSANAAGSFCFQGKCFSSLNTDKILRQHTVDYGRLKGKYNFQEIKTTWPKTQTTSTPSSWMTPNRRSLCVNEGNCVSEPPPKVRLGSADGLIEWVTKDLNDTLSPPIQNVQRIVGDNPLYFSYDEGKTGIAIKVDVVGPAYRSFDYQWGSDTGLDCDYSYEKAKADDTDTDIDCFVPSFPGPPPCGWHTSNEELTWKEAYPPRTNSSTTSFLLILLNAQELYQSPNASMQMSTGKDCSVRVTTSEGTSYNYSFPVSTRVSPPRPIIQKFEIEPSVVKEGQYATLTWQTQAADDIEIYEINDDGTKTLLWSPPLERNSMDVSPPTILGKFQLLARNSGGEAQSVIVELAVQLLGNAWDVFVKGFEFGVNSLTDTSFIPPCTIPLISIDPCGFVTPVNIVKLFFMAFGVPPDITGIMLTAMLVTNGLIMGLLSTVLCSVLGNCVFKSENPLLTWDFLGSVLLNVFNSAISGLASCAPPPAGTALSLLFSNLPTKIGGFLSGFGKFKKGETVSVLGVLVAAPFDLDILGFLPFGIGKWMRDIGSSISNYTENNKGYRAGALLAKSLDPAISTLVAKSCLKAKEDEEDEKNDVEEEGKKGEITTTVEKLISCKDINIKGCELKVGEPKISEIATDPLKAKQLVAASVDTLEVLGEVKGLKELPNEKPSTPGKSVVEVKSGHYTTTEITQTSQLPLDMKEIRTNALEYNLSDGLRKEDAFKKAFTEMFKIREYTDKEINTLLGKTVYVNKMVQCIFSNICGKK